MLKRLPGFTILSLIFIGLCFLPGYLGFLLMWISAMVLYYFASKELANMMGLMERPVLLPLLQGLGSTVLTLVFLCSFSMIKLGAVEEWLGINKQINGVPPLLLVLLVLFLCALPWIVLLCVGVGRKGVDLTVNTTAAFMLLVLPLTALFVIYLCDNGRGTVVCPFLLYLVAVTKMGDTGAYLIGSLSHKLTKGGNHKIAPNVSPNKSWEGAFGGMAFSIGASIGLGLLFFKLPIWALIVLGAALFWGGFFGDLAESSLKRSAGVKDSGTLVPGLGGALDFLDALLINSPLFLLVALLFAEHFS